MKPRVSVTYSRLRIGLPPNIASSCTHALRLSLMKGDELDAELLAVAEQCRVMAGNARRSRVEVQIGIAIEIADLRITGLVDRDRRRAASGCGRRRDAKLRVR